MQRLIDANKLENEINQFDYYDQVKEASTVLEIPENPTNGDMIKALFPNTRFSTSTEDTIAKAFIRPNGSVVINDYCDDWWNAPYKGAEHESNND